MLSLTPFLIALCYVLAASTVQTAALPMVTHVLPDYGVALLDMPDEHLEYLRDAIDQKLGADRAPEPRHNYYPDYASLADHRTVAKREPKRYGFGLGRRSAGFSYTTSGSSGVKRLPVYNFGLGRRRRTEDNTGRLLNDAMRFVCGRPDFGSISGYNSSLRCLIWFVQSSTVRVRAGKALGVGQRTAGCIECDFRCGPDGRCGV